MVSFEGRGTPNILEFKDAIASQLKVNKDLIAIRHIYQRFGFAKAKVIAHIYSDRKELMHLEKLKKAERKAIDAAKKELEEKAKADAEKKAKAEAEREKKLEEAEIEAAKARKKANFQKAREARLAKKKAKAA